ncbi:hypothetical protein [Pseudoxanthomonas japonensis]|uniref:hypothetical protein n=1 Tax=Pseudoxanthomonas japonensis TaxID=69284 RepID=UPI001BCC5E65|nr:hypothetical protein [Pseudoxanthomonas japonensis]
MLRPVISVVLVALLAGCDPERVHVDDEVRGYLAIFDCPQASGAYIPTTIEEVIAEPGRFQEKPIKVSGFYHVSFENSAIYPTASSVEDFASGLWMLVGLDDGLMGKRVTVRGIYDPGRNDGQHQWPRGGHLGQWPGAICVHSMEAVDE